MICYKPEPEIWIEDVAFLAATLEERATGLLGWGTCRVWGEVRLAPMRVTLHGGVLRVKVRSGGLDIGGETLTFGGGTRHEIEDVIEANGSFRDALAEIGVEKESP